MNPEDIALGDLLTISISRYDGIVLYKDGYIVTEVYRFKNGPNINQPRIIKVESYPDREREVLTLSIKRNGGNPRWGFQNKPLKKAIQIVFGEAINWTLRDGNI